MLPSIYWEIAGVSGLKPDWGVVPVLPTTALRKGGLERGEGVDSYGLPPTDAGFRASFAAACRRIRASPCDLGATSTSNRARGRSPSDAATIARVAEFVPLP